MQQQISRYHKLKVATNLLNAYLQLLNRNLLHNDLHKANIFVIPQDCSIFLIDTSSLIKGLDTKHQSYHLGGSVAIFKYAMRLSGFNDTVSTHSFQLLSQYYTECKYIISLENNTDFGDYVSKIIKIFNEFREKIESELREC